MDFNETLHATFIDFHGFHSIPRNAQGSPWDKMEVLGIPWTFRTFFTNYRS